MNIKILGTGCPSCKTLEKLVINSLAELEIDETVKREEDIMKIMGYGIMHTPALVIDEKVIFNGRIPSPKEIKNILLEHQ